MASTPVTPRKLALRELATARPSVHAALNGDHAPTPTSQFFGVNTFGARQMRDKLPKKVYQKLQATIRLGKKLDAEIAPAVAEAIKEWAVSRGVTHFTHWFQPQTGSRPRSTTPSCRSTTRAADRELQHRAADPERAGRLELPVGRAPRDLGGPRLHGVEPGQPGVHRRGPGNAHAVHPSVFIGYNGEALDEMTPLLAARTSSRQGDRAARADGDSGSQRVTPRSAPSRSTS
jgi:glutamine synthetase